MTHNVSESIIDSLTDVKMPHYAPLAQVSGSIDLNGTIYLSTAATRWFWAVARQDGELPSS